MKADLSLRLILPADSDERRIAGRLRDEHGHEHSFSSWLGLLSLLDAAHTRARGDILEPEDKASAGADGVARDTVAPRSRDGHGEEPTVADNRRADRESCAGIATPRPGRRKRSSTTKGGR